MSQKSEKKKEKKTSEKKKTSDNKKTSNKKKSPNKKKTSEKKKKTDKKKSTEKNKTTEKKKTTDKKKTTEKKKPSKKKNKSEESQEINTDLIDDEPIHSSRVSGKIMIRILRASHLPGVDKNGTSDPYVVIRLTKQCKTQFESETIYKATTPIIKNQINPEWEPEYYTFDLKRPMGDIVLTIYDYNRVKKHVVIGEAKLSLEDHPKFFEECKLLKTLDLENLAKPNISFLTKLKKKDKTQNGGEKKPTITFKLKFIPSVEQSSKIGNDIELLQSGILHYQLFKGEFLEQLYETMKRWLTQTAGHGVRVVKIMDGKNSDGLNYLAVCEKEILNRIDQPTGTPSTKGRGIVNQTRKKRLQKQPKLIAILKYVLLCYRQRKLKQGV
ncbi:c2 domain-containing protein [Anaeramoeba flamelloides]|uniref:C2 domain-containing protein n=1 Tax=Anaeramoeba flamelloides TaxID=1746091 RepID=A0ABQ8X582_9EUKA|nr:c2 domain-containing protein [Anaeramoeba flamelloides]